MKINKLTTLFASLLAALLFSGCAAVIVGAGAGAGVYAYVRGEMKGNENHSLDQTWAATQAAMKDLQFNVSSQQKDALQARLIARTAMDKRIEINLTKITDNTTEVTIRVGTFGDQTLSHTIVQAIEKHF
ncbi:MAG: hypothetical protein RLY20_457 [Verrucomicrobiota bacterium]